MRLDMNFYKVKGIITREDIICYYGLKELRNNAQKEVESEEEKFVVDLDAAEALKLVNKIVSRINSQIGKEERKFLVNKKMLIDNAMMVGYFRKHSDLNRYIEDNFVHMEDYPGSEFNHRYVLLTKENLEDILQTARREVREPGGVEKATGPFAGETNLDDWKETIILMEKILIETDFEVESIIYDCRWEI